MAKEAVEELARAIDHLGTAAVQLIMAEREECALTMEALAEETPDDKLKRSFAMGAEEIRERGRP